MLKLMVRVFTLLLFFNYNLAPENLFDLWFIHNYLIYSFDSLGCWFDSI